jgi:hypothetical protein
MVEQFVITIARIALEALQINVLLKSSQESVSYD